MIRGAGNENPSPRPRSRSCPLHRGVDLKYRTIVADPPWPHKRTGVSFVDRTSGRFRESTVPYPTMTVEEISALPVRNLSDNVDEDAHLYLWTTSHYLPQAFTVVHAWGFHYTATLVWCKPERGWSVGGTFQNNVEFVLYCRRPCVVRKPDVLRITTKLADAAESIGLTRADVDHFMGTSDMAGWWLSRIEHRCACPTPEQWERLKMLLKLDDSLDAEVSRINSLKGTDRRTFEQAATGRWFQWPRGRHSAKPEGFLDLVETVSPGPYLELFARRNRLGWDTWGNEALNHIDLGGAS